MTEVGKAFDVLLHEFSDDEDILSSLRQAKELWRRRGPRISQHAATNSREEGNCLLRNIDHEELMNIRRAVESSDTFWSSSPLDFVQKPVNNQPQWILQWIERPHKSLNNLRLYTVLRALCSYTDERAKQANLSSQKFVSLFLRRFSLSKTERNSYYRHMRKGARLLRFNNKALSVLRPHYVSEVRVNHSQETEGLARRIEQSLSELDQDILNVLTVIGERLETYEQEIRKALAESWVRIYIQEQKSPQHVSKKRKAIGEVIDFQSGVAIGNCETYSSNDAVARPTRPTYNQESVDRGGHTCRINSTNPVDVIHVPTPSHQGIFTDQSHNETDTTYLHAPFHQGSVIDLPQTLHQSDMMYVHAPFHQDSFASQSHFDHTPFYATQVEPEPLQDLNLNVAMYLNAPFGNGVGQTANIVYT